MLLWKQGDIVVLL